MVYYGVVSKGCERCRRRKVKCDQRKPACLKCEKSKVECPGYRDLDKVLFRDESERIIRKARQLDQPQPGSVLHVAPGSFRNSIHHSTKEQRSQLRPGLAQEITPEPSSGPENDGLILGHSSPTPSPPALYISCPPSQPVDKLGVSFYFAKYTFNEAPFGGEYHDWLAQSYSEDGSVLQAAIDAVGMAGISNVSYAPRVASRSKERYAKAIAAVNKALRDPVQVVADSTLMAVILLGLYETVNFATSDRYSYWIAHVKGATALLELRGPEQFTRKRGGLLYILIRSQILSACLQQHMAVPHALVRATCQFQTSIIRQQWQRNNVASQASMCEISFRIINLAAAFANREITDVRIVQSKALDIDNDLQAWKARAPSMWGYTAIDASDAVNGAFFDTNVHVYPNLWIAETMNNWRVVRILISKLIIQAEDCSDAPDVKKKAAYLSTITKLSTDICISVSSFTGTPRIISLIRPLYAVALEELNTRRVRLFAIEQLRNIGHCVGMRQTDLLATTVAKTFDENPKDSLTGLTLFTIPLIPFC
ncbi:hypothetical protein B0J13DRAFT_564610 [Dactylonectria estremocensis]|uniref:Zn(2)-C6 fungal-type domain-containing protein n=1 Tax=Dactylonectria estremocensis TaxID=1079267 RepID=A0A9P9DYZ6_9HYPO|nr:hypothetical protein B0J13DRAFT_564610 [Dactylonectria estremocensis]